MDFVRHHSVWLNASLEMINSAQAAWAQRTACIDMQPAVQAFTRSTPRLRKDWWSTSSKQTFEFGSQTVMHSGKFMLSWPCSY